MVGLSTIGKVVAGTVFGSFIAVFLQQVPLTGLVIHDSTAPLPELSPDNMTAIIEDNDASKLDEDLQRCLYRVDQREMNGSTVHDLSIEATKCDYPPESIDEETGQRVKSKKCTCSMEKIKECKARPVYDKITDGKTYTGIIDFPDDPPTVCCVAVYLLAEKALKDGLPCSGPAKTLYGDVAPKCWLDYLAASDAKKIEETVADQEWQGSHCLITPDMELYSKVLPTSQTNGIPGMVSCSTCEEQYRILLGFSSSASSEGSSSSVSSGRPPVTVTKKKELLDSPDVEEVVVDGDTVQKVEEGDELNYRITIENKSTEHSYSFSTSDQNDDFLISDKIPAGFRFKEGSIKPNLGTCSYDGRDLKCDGGNQKLGPGKSLVIDYTVIVGPPLGCNRTGVPKRNELNLSRHPHSSQTAGRRNFFARLFASDDDTSSSDEEPSIVTVKQFCKAETEEYIMDKSYEVYKAKENGMPGEKKGGKVASYGDIVKYTINVETKSGEDFDKKLFIQDILQPPHARIKLDTGSYFEKKEGIEDCGAGKKNGVITLSCDLQKLKSEATLVYYTLIKKPSTESIAEKWCTQKYIENLAFLSSSINEKDKTAKLTEDITTNVGLNCTDAGVSIEKKILGEEPSDYFAGDTIQYEVSITAENDIVLKEGDEVKRELYIVDKFPRNSEISSKSFPHSESIGKCAKDYEGGSPRLRCPIVGEDSEGKAVLTKGKHRIRVSIRLTDEMVCGSNAIVNEATVFTKEESEDIQIGTASVTRALSCDSNISIDKSVAEDSRDASGLGEITFNVLFSNENEDDQSPIEMTHNSKRRFHFYDELPKGLILYDRIRGSYISLDLLEKGQWQNIEIGSDDNTLNCKVRPSNNYEGGMLLWCPNIGPKSEFESKDFFSFDYEASMIDQADCGVVGVTNLAYFRDLKRGNTRVDYDEVTLSRPCDSEFVIKKYPVDLLGNTLDEVRTDESFRWKIEVTGPPDKEFKLQEFIPDNTVWTLGGGHKYQLEDGVGDFGSDLNYQKLPSTLPSEKHRLYKKFELKDYPDNKLVVYMHTYTPGCSDTDEIWNYVHVIVDDTAVAEGSSYVSYSCTQTSSSSSSRVPIIVNVEKELPGKKVLRTEGKKKVYEVERGGEYLVSVKLTGNTQYGYISPIDELPAAMVDGQGTGPAGTTIPNTRPDNCKFLSKLKPKYVRCGPLELGNSKPEIGYLEYTIAIRDDAPCGMHDSVFTYTHAYSGERIRDENSIGLWIEDCKSSSSSEKSSSSQSSEEMITCANYTPDESFPPGAECIMGGCNGFNQECVWDWSVTDWDKGCKCEYRFFQVEKSIEQYDIDNPEQRLATVDTVYEDQPYVYVVKMINRGEDDIHVIGRGDFSELLGYNAYKVYETMSPVNIIHPKGDSEYIELESGEGFRYVLPGSTIGDFANTIFGSDDVPMFGDFGCEIDHSDRSQIKMFCEMPRGLWKVDEAKELRIPFIGFRNGDSDVADMNCGDKVWNLAELKSRGAGSFSFDAHETSGYMETKFICEEPPKSSSSKRSTSSSSKQPRITLSKTIVDPKDVYLPGDTIAFNVTVKNNTSKDIEARSISIVDDLPAIARLSIGNESNLYPLLEDVTALVIGTEPIENYCRESELGVSCTFPVIEKGSEANISIVAKVASGLPCDDYGNSVREKGGESYAYVSFRAGDCYGSSSSEDVSSAASSSSYESVFEYIEVDKTAIWQGKESGAPLRAGMPFEWVIRVSQEMGSFAEHGTVPYYLRDINPDTNHWRIVPDNAVGIASFVDNGKILLKYSKSAEYAPKDPLIASFNIFNALNVTPDGLFDLRNGRVITAADGRTMKAEDVYIKAYTNKDCQNDYQIYNRTYVLDADDRTIASKDTDPITVKCDKRYGAAHALTVMQDQNSLGLCCAKDYTPVAGMVNATKIRATESASCGRYVDKQLRNHLVSKEVCGQLVGGDRGMLPGNFFYIGAGKMSGEHLLNLYDLCRSSCPLPEGET